jgi:hypothetical protein
MAGKYRKQHPGWDYDAKPEAHGPIKGMSHSEQFLSFSKDYIHV